ncbi:hypothetical protein WJX77_005900 [Trebouxia sp. C0004]
MPPKRKASASKGLDTKKTKRESPTAKDTVTTAETAEVWFSVEHWAAEICKLLQERRPELEIKLNPSKPRKGCFEIQDQSGKTFVSLLNMPRPFKQLRELDIAKIADDMAANMTTAKEGMSSPSGDNGMARKGSESSNSAGHDHNI